jgi:hypothetical protein
MPPTIQEGKGRGSQAWGKPGLQSKFQILSQKHKSETAKQTKPCKLEI